MAHLRLFLASNDRTWRAMAAWLGERVQPPAPCAGVGRPGEIFDLDGHGWQVIWMDPAAMEQGPEAFAASMQNADAPA